jgi:Ulp1 family protease
MHWSLVVVELHNRTMTYYDSLRWNGREYMKTLSHLFAEYLSRVKPDDEGNKTISTINAADRVIDLNSEFSDDQNNDWEFKAAIDIPTQENSYDCGVFLCKYMDYISRGETINFTQQEMGYFRLLMTVEILEGKLMI